MELWVIAGIVWLACAIACGFLAPMRGRPSGEWFWTGLIFGIFGLAFLALAEPEDRSTWRVCASCGKPVDPDRKNRCNNCGEVLRQA